MTEEQIQNIITKYPRLAALDKDIETIAKAGGDAETCRTKLRELALLMRSVTARFLGLLFVVVVAASAAFMLLPFWWALVVALVVIVIGYKAIKILAFHVAAKDIELRKLVDEGLAKAQRKK